MSEGLVLALQGSRYLLFAPMVVIRSEGARIFSGHKRCHKLALGPADPANQRGRDCGRPGSKNKAVARRLDRRADPGEVLEQIVGKIYICRRTRDTSSSAGASGIGVIGLNRRMSPAFDVHPP